MRYIFYHWSSFNRISSAEITYDETKLTYIVSFKDLNLGLSTNNDYLVYNYQATFRVYDIGSTVIDGLLEMIEAEKIV